MDVKLKNIKIIREPYWKYDGVGVAERNLTDRTYIICTYRNSDDEYNYPYLYSISKERALEHKPEFTNKGHVKLHIIPFRHLRIEKELTAEKINQIKQLKKRRRKDANRKR